MEISFHIPNSNTQFVGDENRPPAQVGVCFKSFRLNYSPLLIIVALW